MITKDVMLNIIYRFKDYEYIVFCSDNSFYQLPNCEGKRTKPLRKLNEKLIGGSVCLLINRKPVTIKKLRTLAVKTLSLIHI